MQQRMTVPDL